MAADDDRLEPIDEQFEAHIARVMALADGPHADEVVDGMMVCARVARMREILEGARTREEFGE